MEEKTNQDKISDEEKENIRDKLDDIKENLLDQLADLIEEMDDKRQDLKEEREDIREDFEEFLEDIREEKDEYYQEWNELKNESESINSTGIKQLEALQRRIEKNKQKVTRAVKKFTAKAKKFLDKAEKKAAKRINISVDPEMSDDWKDWAEGLGTSVSELVRKSMEFVKGNVGDLKKLEKIGEAFEKMGGNIEMVIKQSGLEDLGEKIENEFAKKKMKVVINTKSEKERIKKRVIGLIKLHKSLPIDKLAQALEKSNEDAENLVYELVADEIKGTLEGGVFKFTSDSEEVISKLNKLIDKM